MEPFVEIPENDLPKLALLYERNCISWAPYMVSFVHMAIRWKKKEKLKDQIKIWSPFNSWQETGTIIVMIKIRTCDIVVFTLSEETNLYIYEALKQMDVIDHSLRVMFYAVHEKHLSVVIKYIEEEKLNINFNIPCYIFAMPPEKGKQLTTICPDEVYLKKLEPSAAEQVNNSWPHRFDGSQDYLASFIEANGGWGVFLKSNDEMVAWVLKHIFGHLAMLQTEEGYKKKGYGSLVLKALAKEIADEGHWPMGTILLENSASISMFEKLGFCNIGICNFIGVNK